MVKALVDYLTICVEVLTQVRGGFGDEKREKKGRQREGTHIGRLFAPPLNPDLSLSFQKKQKQKTTPQRLRLRSVPPIDEVGGPIEGLTCIVTGPTR